MVGKSWPAGFLQEPLGIAHPRRHPHPHRVKIHYVDSSRSRPRHENARDMDAILVPAASASAASRASRRGALRAREQVPYLGICLGCRSPYRGGPRPLRAGGRQLHGVRPRHAAPVVALITEWQDATEDRAPRRELEPRRHDALGAQPCNVKKGTLANRVYGTTWSRSAIATATSERPVLGAAGSSGAHDQRGPERHS